MRAMSWLFVPFFGVGAAFLSGTVLAVDLPEGEPPQSAAKRVNVATFGAHLADDEQDDTPAVNAALKAAGNNSTLYFPAGTYNVRWVDVIKNRDGLSLAGDGPDKSILKRMGPFWKDGAEPTWENLRANFATDPKILRIEDCSNMCIRDLGFNANGTPTFGGVGIKRPKRLHITRTRSFDSKEQPPLFGKDRFAWAIMGFEQGSQNIWFVDNTVEGLQTEMDGANRVLVERSVFKRSVKSPGLGFLSGNFSKAEFANGFQNTHLTVRRNYFSNSDNLSMGMLAFQLDPSTNCNTRFADIDIMDNVFVYDIDSSHGHCAIKLGTGDSSAKTRGNVFERFRIENNRIYRSPKAKIDERFPAYIWYNCYAGEDRLNHTFVRDNRLFADAPAKPLLAVGRQNQSVGLTVDDNAVKPYQEPPTVEQFMKLAPQRQRTGMKFIPADVDWERPVYQTSFDGPAALEDWKLEGGLRMSVANGSLILESKPGSTKSEANANHLVCWLKKEMPADFLLEFTVRPQNRKQGLNIVFFNARGIRGQSIFDSALASRDGSFEQYHSGDLNCYHISYWAAGRGSVNVRKNRGFHFVAEGKDLVTDGPADAFQTVRIYKRGGVIRCMVDDLVSVAYDDDGTTFGPTWTHRGWIGLRQMGHTVCCEYGHLKVWPLRPEP